MDRYLSSSAPGQADDGFFSPARLQSSLIMESVMSSSSKYKQDLGAKRQSRPTIAGWGGVATHERTQLAI